ncbi:hypothetical protein GCM10011519_34570 [Marmoricola endophyticus]|uniref:Glucanase n=1 Tax=Marmoricola endophyticus TaxID=2040280 RepID=A0A917F8G1_9ACTN|nr:glycoside hydrolase family 6 protein [Marmoricola endophyticus]GGF57742.1 hypothetical protein GCM10011519_34570 [Marmoricola endophyticus]
MPRRSSLRRLAVACLLAGLVVSSTGGAVLAAPLPADAAPGAQAAADAAATAARAPAVARRAAATSFRLERARLHRSPTARVPSQNPLAGRTWGVYKGPGDQAWPPYEKATGETKTLLGAIALAPKAKWFGTWISESQIESKVRDYVANASGGDPETLVQATVFNLKPWEHEACTRLPTSAEQTSYKRWIDGFARGVGAQHTAIILQPDGPFAMCVPGGSGVPSGLISYAAQKFSALPHTAVYIDGGAADWPYKDVNGAVDFLVRDGIRYARGVALNSTHYSATGDEVERGTAIVTELARRGIADKHVVVNTSSNGRPFVFGDAPGKDPDNATVCASRTSTHCVTLGIRPTTDVANARWGLTAAQQEHARAYVDGYLWFGRPWLYRQADPFDMERALQLVRTTPYS